MNNWVKQLTIFGAALAVALVVETVVGRIAVGDREGGLADALHVVQMFLLVLAPTVLVVAGVARLIRGSRSE